MQWQGSLPPQEGVEIDIGSMLFAVGLVLALPPLIFRVVAVVPR
jgi:hypothetical protein